MFSQILLGTVVNNEVNKSIPPSLAATAASKVSLTYGVLVLRRVCKVLIPRTSVAVTMAYGRIRGSY